MKDIRLMQARTIDTKDRLRSFFFRKANSTTMGITVLVVLSSLFSFMLCSITTGTIVLETKVVNRHKTNSSGSSSDSYKRENNMMFSRLQQAREKISYHFLKRLQTQYGSYRESSVARSVILERYFTFKLMRIICVFLFFHFTQI